MSDKTTAGHDYCADCGMTLTDYFNYHPYAACVLYRQLGQADKVESALYQVLEYGARAERQGVSINDARRDIRKVKY